MGPRFNVSSERLLVISWPAEDSNPQPVVTRNIVFTSPTLYIPNELIGLLFWSVGNVQNYFISCFPVGYREISVEIFFDLTLVRPVKIPIFMFLLPRLIARASQPDGSMTSFTLHFPHLT